MRSPAPSQLAAILVLLAGCSRQDGLRTRGGQAPSETPTAASLLASHNDGLSRLVQLHAMGVVELKWSDEQGSHHDQGDIELWLRCPTHTAIRIHKSAVGEEFLWLGTDGSRYWIFDRRKHDEVDASIGSIDDELALAGGDSAVLRPRAFLDLCGLSRFDEAPGQPVSFNAELDAWQTVVRGQSGDVRASFDRRTRRLLALELLDGQGSPVARSQMKPQRYASVPIDNAPLGAFPSIATLIAISSIDGDAGLRARPSQERQDAACEILVSLDQDSLDGRDSPSFTDRVFDLDLLMKRFRPVRVNAQPVALQP